MKQNNPQLHGYSQEPVYDCHFHTYLDNKLQDTKDILCNVMKHYNYDKALINCLPNSDVTENCKGFYLKSVMSPKIYVNAGLTHWMDSRDTAELYLEQIKSLHAMGCDGIKMLEGKLELHRLLHTPKLDDKVYDKFFEYAEENEIPILMHVGDPLYFWENPTPWIVEQGWTIDPGEPTLEQLRSEVDGILKKFPKLHLVMAHFYFLSDELERAAKLFDTYENLCFDLTPGGEMFVSFCANPKESKEFFIKYKDRLIYGTDTYNYLPNGQDEEQLYGATINLLRSFLEKDCEFEVTHPDLPDMHGKKLFGMHFDRPVLDSIYRDNFNRVFGAQPRPLDFERIYAECKDVCAQRELSALQQQNMKIISDYFKK